MRRKDHRLTLPPRLQPAGDEIRAALTARPFDPPSRKELIRGEEAADALRFLCQTGEVIFLSEEIILGAPAFTEMKSRITEALRERGTATASELRQVLGATRRVLIPLLEYLDRIGLTTRQGDRRTLRERLR